MFNIKRNRRIMSLEEVLTGTNTQRSVAGGWPQRTIKLLFKFAPSELLKFGGIRTKNY